MKFNFAVLRVWSFIAVSNEEGWDIYCIVFSWMFGIKEAQINRIYNLFNLPISFVCVCVFYLKETGKVLFDCYLKRWLQRSDMQHS
jgi:hypothetical protein